MARQFTVAEANELLPAIIPLLEDLRDLAARLTKIRDELATVTPAGRRNGQANRVLQLETEAAAAAPRAEALLRQLYVMCVEVKDPSTGLIDFRSLRGGEEIYLCWRLGEGQIAWWHDLESGFQGRRPL
jgi:hypothetical protein